MSPTKQAKSQGNIGNMSLYMTDYFFMTDNEFPFCTNTHVHGLIQ